MPNVPAELNGLDEIRAWGERVPSILEFFVQNAHPGTIQLDGDTASGRVYMHEVIGLRDGRSEHRGLGLRRDLRDIPPGPPRGKRARSRHLPARLRRPASGAVLQVGIMAGRRQWPGHSRPVGFCGQCARARGSRGRHSRNGAVEWAGTASTGQLHRRYDELIRYLMHSDIHPEGAVLSTGTCLVPPMPFTLDDGHLVRISVGEVGTLQNPVVRGLAAVRESFRSRLDYAAASAQ